MLVGPTGEDAMARTMALCLALCGLTATAIAQTVPAPETWTPVGRMAQTVAGRVTFVPTEISFQDSPLTDVIGHVLHTGPRIGLRTKTGAVVEIAADDVVAVRTLTAAPVRSG